MPENFTETEYNKTDKIVAAILSKVSLYKEKATGFDSLLQIKEPFPANRKFKGSLPEAWVLSR